MNIDCVICFQRQALRALKDIKDIKVKERVLRSVMALLLNEDWTKSPPELAGKVYKIITKESGIIDPYKDLKKKSNDLVLGIYNKLKDECLNSKDPIIHALRFAVAGNIIDFGASDKFDFQKTIDMVVNAKFEIDKSDKLKEKLETSK